MPTGSQNRFGCPAVFLLDLRTNILLHLSRLMGELRDELGAAQLVSAARPVERSADQEVQPQADGGGDLQA